MAKLRELSTTPDPDTIAIDGKDYPLVDPGNLSTVETAAMRRKAQLLVKLQGKADLTDDEAREADTALAELWKTVAPAVPEEVGAKLTTEQKAQVIGLFFLSRAERVKALTDSMKIPPSAPTSSPSSGASSASTAAQSPNG